jgi:hypothetical protein
MKTIKIISKIVAISISLLAVNQLDAQIKLGLRGGFNTSNVSFDKLNRAERYGFHAGMFADIVLASNFVSLQPELSYSVKGTSFKVLDINNKLNMNYVDLLLPVAFKLSNFDLAVGPFTSYLISKPDFSSKIDKITVGNAFNKFDAGLTAGLSGNFSKLLIGVRYNQGLSNVAKSNVKPILGTGKTAVGQVSIGYRF